LSFEAPTKEWASRQSVPTVNLYLYDLREDVERREVQLEPVRDETGRVVTRRPPARRYRLSYLVSAWTQRPEDEHRLLASLLACFLRSEVLDREVLVPELAEQPHRVLLRVAHPPAKERALADVWSAIGGELKAALDLVVDVPFDAQRVHDAGPPVLEPMELRVRRAPPKPVPEPAPPVPPHAAEPEPEPEAETPPAAEPEVVRKRRWWQR
jgi:Pvc16 N-terminal domain